MFEWDKLFDSPEKYYYTPLLMFVVELTALVVAIIYGRKTKIGRLFIFYIAIDFSCSIIDSLLEIYSGQSDRFLNKFIIKSNTLIGLTELLVYYYFFYKIPAVFKIKLLLISFAAVFTLMVILYFITGLSFFSTRLAYVSTVIGAIEFFFLLLPCLYYFYTILTAPSQIKLFERPSFWIVTGIFFYSVISIPFYLANKYMLNNYKEFIDPLAAIFYYIPFTLNFAFLIKAFLCKKTLTI